LKAIKGSKLPFAAQSTKVCYGPFTLFDTKGGLPTFAAARY